SCFSDSFPLTAPAASLARPFTSSTTPSTPALGPDSFSKIVSRCFPMYWCSRPRPLPADLGRKRAGRLPGDAHRADEDRHDIDLVHDHVEVVGLAVLAAAALAPGTPPVLHTLHWDLRKHANFYSGL